MEPIKFEDNIREKLQEREIEPSEDAWEKLQSKLAPTPKENSNRSIWFAVAASFIGIIIIASLLVNDEGSSITNPSHSVVENADKSDIIDKKEKDLFLDKNTNRITSKEIKRVDKEENPTMIEPDVMTKNVSDLTQISAKSVKDSSKTSDIEKSEIIASIKKVNEEILIDSKVDEVAVQSQVLQKDKMYVSKDEINSLLLKAQFDIQAQKLSSGMNKKVDATALLKAVEYDIETSFRDKVFEALGDGFEKVKTAVVERKN